MMGGSVVDLPEERDFPKTLREGTWSGRSAFAEHATKILVKRYGFEFYPFQRERTIVYLTNYRALTQVKPPLSAEVAVLILHEGKTQARKVPFQVKFVARERRSLSAYRPSESSEVKEAAGQFVTELLEQLQSTKAP
jgi:hypothetical protein